ncbi:hypothetical protein FJY90_05995, partial [Candidatus Gottesmanbacteria bacterium]|nr:hypothetical protein [Candidatus Gottesmanbacteria bacterium]
MPSSKNRNLIALVITGIIFLSCLIVFLVTFSTKETKEIKSRAQTKFASPIGKIKPQVLTKGTLMAKFQPVTNYRQEKEAGAANVQQGETNLGFDPKPSLNGFSENLFSGSINASLPIDVPTGPGGFTPRISLAYSSSTVDDSHLGLNNQW